MTQHNLFPRAVTTADISTMRRAVRLAVDQFEADTVKVAPVVFKLYGQGLTDPVKLAHVSSLLVTSRAFH